VTAAGDGGRRTVTLPPPETRDEPRACLSLVIERRLAMSGLMLLGWSRVPTGALHRSDARDPADELLTVARSEKRLEAWLLRSR
jgi:hypothetical protein